MHNFARAFRVLRSSLLTTVLASDLLDPEPEQATVRSPCPSPRGRWVPCEDASTDTVDATTGRKAQRASEARSESRWSALRVRTLGGREGARCGQV
jgi:hypothetical protein